MNYSRNRTSGIALVITLLVIVILTIAVTAFMQSMSLERRTSSAFLNILKAQEAAEAAEQTALASIAKLKNKPAAAIYAKGAASPDSPYLYLANASLSPAPPLTATARLTTGEALFSTAQSQPTDLHPSTAPVPIATQLIVPDLNAAGKLFSRKITAASSVTTNINQKGTVGLQNSSATNLDIPVNWKYLQTKEGKTVGRYAYWCEDESSKLDLRTAGNTNGPVQIHKRGQGETLDDVSLHALSKLTPGFTTSNVQNILAFRETVMGRYGLGTRSFRYPFESGPNASISDADWQKLQPYVTVFSDHDDRSPDGNRKLDLNALAESPDRLGAVRAMRDVIKANLPDFGSRYYRYDNHTSATTYTFASPAPVIVSDADKEDYLTKISVNILDFIDGDRLPTVIIGRQSDTPPSEKLLTGRADPTFGGEVDYGANTVAELPVAVGKEATAYLSEYLQIARPISANGVMPYADPGVSASYTLVFRLTHYIELRNLSSKQISVEDGDLGVRPFIQISNRRTWKATATAPAPGTTTTIRPVDIEIRLPSELVIPPNGYVTLSTDSHPPAGQSSPRTSGTIYTIDREPYKPNEADRTPGKWSEAQDPASDPNNPTPLHGSNDEDYSARASRYTSSGTFRWRVSPQTSTSDYASATTRMILGNTTGFLDYVTLLGDSQNKAIGASSTNIPTAIPVASLPFDNTTSSEYNNNVVFPNLDHPLYARGDPRSNVEIKYDTFDGRMGTKTSGADFSAVVAQSSLGSVNTVVNTTTTNWQTALPEFTNEGRGNLFSLDDHIHSLGELGAVYDPASVDKTYRPANRTLKIGQPDSPANNRLFAPNDPNTDNDKIWTGGFGSDDPADPKYERNAFRLLDLFRTDAITNGRVNLNGILRGGSVIFDAAGKPSLRGNAVILDSLLDQFAFNNNTTSGAAQGSDNISGANLAETEGVKNLANAVAGELGATKPFLSAGDLSRLQIFTSTSPAMVDRLAGLSGATSMHGVSDSGREEFFRRTANLLTTAPLSFTIYSVGQTGEFISDTSDVFRVRATSYVKTIVTLVPHYPDFSAITTGPPSSWKIDIRSKIFQ